MSPSTHKQKYSVINQTVLLGAILTLGHLANTIHKSSRVYLFQQAQCRVYYKTADPSKIDSQHHVDEALCKISEVQSPLSMIDGVDSFLTFLSPLFVLATYKELLPRVGLRSLVLLSLCCSGLDVLYLISVFWLHRDWATPAALLSFLFNLIGGGGTVRTIIVMKCIADILPPERLANSYNYISAFFFLGSVGGSAIGSLMLSHHVYKQNGLSIACYALTACVAATIPAYLGHEQQGDENAVLITNDADDTTKNTSRSPSPEGSLAARTYKVKPSPLRILLNSWHSSYHSLLTLFNAPRPTFTILLIYLLNGLAMQAEVLLPQYTSLLLSWPLAVVNRAMALKALISALILFMLPTLRRIYLQPRMTTPQIDLFITQSSLIANTLGVIGLGISAPAGFFILSLCVYTSGIGLSDSLTAYGTCTLPAGESVSELYVRIGLINTIAALAGAPLWSAVFSLVLRSEVLPLGLPFWMCAGVFGAGVGGVVALKRE